jgi:hypothetical protein
MMPITRAIDPLVGQTLMNKHPIFPGKSTIACFFIIALLCATGAAFTDSLLYLPLLPIGVAGAYFFLIDPRVRFASTLAIIMLLQIFETVSFFGYLAAAIFNGGLLLVIVERRFIQHRRITPVLMLLPFTLFFLWGAGFGFLNVVLGGVRFEQWYREVLIWAPLFLFPIYYQDIVKQDLNSEKFLKWTFIILWLVVFAASYTKIRNNLPL